MAPLSVSVIVPCYNAAAHIRRCLEGLGRQDYTNFDVVVVDDGSTDDTRAILRAFSSVKVVGNPENRGPGYSRNRGIEASGGDLIVFLDSDCIVADPRWLSRHVRAHERLEETILGGGIVGTGRGLVARADAYCHWITNVPLGPPRECSALTPRSPLLFSRHLVTTNMSLPRASVLRIGMFDETLRTGEDLEFCERALTLGFRLRLQPDIVVTHRDRERISEFFWCFYRAGKDRIPARRRHQSPYYWLMPAGIVSSLALCLPLAILAPLQPIKAWWAHDKRVVLYYPLLSLASLAMACGMIAYWAGKGRGEGDRAH